MNALAPASHRAARAGFARYQPGGTIGIPPDATVTLARVCDFTQPAVVLRKTVVCVLRAPRGVRASE
jgi:hypothetical protein